MITNNLVKRKKSSQNCKRLKMSSIIILSPVCKENKTKQNTQKLNQNRNHHWLEEGFLPTYPNSLTFSGLFLLESHEVKVLHSLGPLPWAQPGLKYNAAQGSGSQPQAIALLPCRDHIVSLWPTWCTAWNWQSDTWGTKDPGPPLVFLRFSLLQLPDEATKPSETALWRLPKSHHLTEWKTLCAEHQRGF